MEEKEIPLTVEEKAYADMNEALDNIKQQRKELADILITSAKNTKLNCDNDAPRVTEVKIMLFKALDDMLKSQELLHVNKVKVGLTKKSEDSNENVKQMAIEILRNIDMTKINNNPVKVTEAVDTVLETTFNNAISNDKTLTEINDDELVMETK